MTSQSTDKKWWWSHIREANGVYSVYALRVALILGTLMMIFVITTSKPQFVQPGLLEKLRSKAQSLRTSVSSNNEQSTATGSTDDGNPSIDDDQAWAHKIHQRQEADRKRVIGSNPDMPRFIYTAVPTVWCPAPLVRVGNVVDGGKWMCRPWRLQKHCIIYSFGVGNDNSWETEMLQMHPSCKTYSFDPNPAYANLFQGKSNMEFRPYALGGVADHTQNKATFKSIQDEFKHKQVDVLKVDIEGPEYTIMPVILNNQTTMKPICQIFIEMHATQAATFSGLVKLHEKHGYLMYAREVLFCGAPCSEYSFIHESCLEQYGMKKSDRLYRMA